MRFKQDGENSTDSEKDIVLHNHFFKVNLPLFFVCVFSFVFSESSRILFQSKTFFFGISYP